MTSSDVYKQPGLIDISLVISASIRFPEREKNDIFSINYGFSGKICAEAAVPTKTDSRFPVWVTLLISERDIGIRNRVFLRKKYYGYRCNEHKTGSI
jgi:hypothetical protein